jgi:hypothetical protein
MQLPLPSQVPCSLQVLPSLSTHFSLLQSRGLSNAKEKGAVHEHMPRSLHTPWSLQVVQVNICSTSSSDTATLMFTPSLEPSPTLLRARTLMR